MSHIGVNTTQRVGFLLLAGFVSLLAVAALSGNGSGGSDGSVAAVPHKTAPDRLVVGPGEEYQTINAALEAAASGTIVEVKAGIYPETVLISAPVILEPFGDGPVWIDGDCERDTGIWVYSGAAVSVAGLGVRNTNGAGVLIGNTGDDAQPPNHVTIDGLTIQDFNCSESDVQANAGVAVWHARCCMTIINNTITYRTSGDVHGRGDGIWFKSTDETPSGGSHIISANRITGGWDGIGGEAEDEIRGSFDSHSTIQDNVIKDCWDDGIQVEGGNENTRVRRNDISGCGTGIAFAPTRVGVLDIKRNIIHDLAVGLYENQFCFKVGGDGQENGVVHLTENLCDTEGDGIMHTNSGLPAIVSRGNCFLVTRYVLQIGAELPAGTSFDEDTMWTSDPERFVSWKGNIYDNIRQFQTTGEESSGVESRDCPIEF
ncbi:MAG: right-handed parallel beta-helix repeat-containing protein [Dehalococcoidia bacterium]